MQERRDFLVAQSEFPQSEFPHANMPSDAAHEEQYDQTSQDPRLTNVKERDTQQHTARQVQVSQEWHRTSYQPPPEWQDQNTFPSQSEPYIKPEQPYTATSQQTRTTAGPLPNTADGSLLQLMNAQMNTQVKYMEQMAMQQQQNALSLQLPNSEIQTFTGDPVDYCSFMTAFENLIEAKTQNNSTRLHYLVQYTRGEAQTLMRSCLTMHPDQGYIEAKKLLKKYFGKDFHIATAYIERITKAVPIKTDDRKALHNYYVQLLGCYNTLQNIGYASKIENPDSLKAVIGNLPYDLKKRWRNQADWVSEMETREVAFVDIVRFIEKEARAMSHPVFGDISNHKDSHDRQKSKHASGQKGTSFSTQITENTELKNPDNSRPYNSYKVSCVLCHQDHRIDTCDIFLKKSYEDRVDYVKKRGLCFNCLIPRHRLRECRKGPMCNHCTYKHHSLLHRPNQQDANVKSPVIVEGRNGYIDGGSAICLPILPVKVRAKNGSGTIITYAFLDSGSNSTFCSESLMKKLGIQGEDVTFSLTTLTGENYRTNSQIASLEVADLSGEHIIELPTVFSRKDLPVNLDDAPKQTDIRRWPHLEGIDVPDTSASTTGVGLLIGNDIPLALEPQEIRNSKDGGPYAVRTLLGWVVNGPLGRLHARSRHTVNFTKTKLDEQFQEFCNREFNDCMASTEVAMSQEDKQALKIMEDTVNFKDGHYELALPFRKDPRRPDNKPLVEHRLNLLKRRLIKDADLRQKYQVFMATLFEKRYAEEVPSEELARSDGMVWYLPHHPVTHPKKPDKVRVVFDCSAKYRETSLNDRLLQGPDWTNSLVGVLTRFRQAPVAMTSDIEAMFHQVKVTPSHRDALRFLWWENGNMDREPKVFRMTVHLFGAVSSPSCCNFALRKTAEDNKSDFDGEVCRTVLNNFYVDDCLKSQRDESNAAHLIEQLVLMLSRGGFHLTKWTSNSGNVVRGIPVEERASRVKMNIDEVERTLGVQWNIKSDAFVFKITLQDRPKTRRGILSMMSSIYDPLGFIAPVVLPVKILLQDLCRKGIDWDGKIPEEHEKIWKTWLCELHRLEDFSIRRCVEESNNIATRELHHFSDASESGYGAVSYLRLLHEDGSQIQCSFMLAKSRLSPLKATSIPRLELSAAVLSVRLDRMLRSHLELPIHRSVFWTDSTSNLKYIRNEDQRFQTFVANRIAVIRDGSNKEDWRYVPSKENPADDASRGLTAENIVRHGARWSTGPGFLCRPESVWPTEPNVTQVNHDDPEIKQRKTVCATVVAENTLDKMLSRFSSWYELKKFVAWILRAKENLKMKSQGKTHTDPILPLTVAEIRQAEVEIVKYVQRQSFPEEFRGVIKSSSMIRRLDPTRRADGVLCVGGRLSQSTMSSDKKHQMILPKRHHVVELIVRHYHMISAHSGQEHVLSLIRERFWIVHARNTVRRVLRNCFNCKRRSAPTGLQKMADLPKQRLTPDRPPFSYVGVDYFGLLLVKRGRSQVKRYGCVFTCLTVRAIHIEVAYSLDTSSFIQALHRFICRRGQPIEIRSDNGTNFIGAQRELKEVIAEWNQVKIEEFLKQQEIQWIFNPPTASHMGGIWERQIRTIRKILNSLVKQQTLDDEGLATLLCQAEAIVNARPITTVSTDTRDPEPLTPNHLILLRAGPSLPPGNFTSNDNYSRIRWRQVQYMADVFWRRWQREYLPALQHRQKWLKQDRNFQVGDVVLVVEDNNPRCVWPLGRITNTYPGKDGLVRTVQVKLRNTSLTRPISKLCLLEAVCDEP